MLKKILLLSALGGMLLSAGCIKEDLSSCVPGPPTPVPETGIEMSFEYIINNSGNDLFGAEVSRVTVYVFDEAGLYVSTFTESGANLSAPGSKLKMLIPSGKYTLLTLGGTLSNYSIQPTLTPGTSRLADFKVALNSTDGVGALPSPLFYATNTVNVIEEQLAQAKASLMKDSSRVVIRITEKYRENSPAAHSYGLTLSGTNNIVDKDNKIPANAPVLSYDHSPFTVTGNVYETYFDIMRLIEGNRVDLKLTHPDFDRPIINDDLLRLIQATGSYPTQLSLDKEDLFIIEIEVSKDPEPTNPSLTVVVKINGWKVVIVYGRINETIKDSDEKRYL